MLFHLLRNRSDLLLIVMIKLLRSIVRGLLRLILILNVNLILLNINCRQWYKLRSINIKVLLINRRLRLSNISNAIAIVVAYRFIMLYWIIRLLLWAFRIRGLLACLHITRRICQKRLKWNICGSSWKGGLFYPAHEISILSHISKIWHIIIGGKINDSRFRKYLKPFLERHSPIFLTMIIRTVGFNALFAMFTGVYLIIFRMVFLFLPPMG